MRYAVTLVTMITVLLMGYFRVDTRVSLALVVFSALALVVLMVKNK